jgi:diguanylate cyclase (GGDEF)-like protein
MTDTAFPELEVQQAPPTPQIEAEALSARVLVVDDHEDNVELICQALEDYDYETIRASDGHQAIDLARRERPDLIILDVMMPGLDGFATCKLLKAHEATSNIPVIFVTAKGEVADLRQGLEAGAHDYLRKPFDPAELVVRVQAAERFKRKQDELDQALLELAARNRELARLAVIDGLSQLYNHSHFLKLLELEFSRAARYDKFLSVLMIDIDFFKRVNDRHGHRAGDRLLRELADILRAQVRSSDIVGRYGGEEFAATLPETDLEQAKMLAERLRRAVEEHVFEIGSDEPVRVRVTVSIGVAAYPGAAANRMEDLIEEADRKLYQAKSEGRNRVCC